ncbi:hypothetical protein BIWAKO_06936 [Bosea sp. BIWAKO-01]|nr:hypothetical protein BIWAKO_06936 [Bosea sp. BIWAKO-01]
MLGHHGSEAVVGEAEAASRRSNERIMLIEQNQRASVGADRKRCSNRTFFAAR